MPLISEMFPSKYVSTPDLKGRPVTMTISHVVLEEVTEGKPKEWVLYFIRAEKGMVLKPVNTQSIADMLGEDTNFWADKQIQLYPTTTEFRGKIVPCIRVQAPPPAAAPAPPPVAAPASPIPDVGGDPEDLIPF